MKLGENWSGVGIGCGSIVLCLLSCISQPYELSKVPSGRRVEWAAAEAASESGDWMTAAGRWNEIFLQGGPRAQGACRETVRALCELGALESAQGVIELGLERYPGDAELLVCKGNVLVRRGFRRAAERTFEQSLAAAPDAPDALLALGRVRIELDLEASAREPLERRIELGYDGPETSWLLGTACWACADVPGAIVAFQRSIDAGLDEVDALVSIASRCLESRAQCPEALHLAVQALRRAVSLDPQCTRAHYYMGQVLEAFGEDKLALRHYRRAVETDPSWVPVLIRLAEFNAACGNPVGARTMAERALTLELEPGERERIEALLEGLGEAPADADERIPLPAAQTGTGPRGVSR